MLAALRGVTQATNLLHSHCKQQSMHACLSYIYMYVCTNTNNKYKCMMCRMGVDHAGSSNRLRSSLISNHDQMQTAEPDPKTPPDRKSVV